MKNPVITAIPVTTAAPATTKGKHKAPLQVSGVLSVYGGNFPCPVGNRRRAALKSAEEINFAMEAYADMVRRICFLHLKNRYDTEDVFQNVYMKYMLYEGAFESSEHEKAWFVRVTINACKDLLRYFSRRKWVPLDVIAEEREAFDDTDEGVLEVVLKLPEKYRSVIYLYYFEGYSATEIAGILGRKENTIYTWLARAKALLREQLGGEWA